MIVPHLLCCATLTQIRFRISAKYAHINIIIWSKKYNYYKKYKKQ